MPNMARPGALQALLTGSALQVRTGTVRLSHGFTPLAAVVKVNLLDAHNRAACVRLLLDASCTLACGQEDVVTVAPGNEACTRLIEEAAALHYSRNTHHRFPANARAYAATLLRLGRQIAKAVLPQQHSGEFMQP